MSIGSRKYKARHALQTVWIVGAAWAVCGPSVDKALRRDRRQGSEQATVLVQGLVKAAHELFDARLRLWIQWLVVERATVFCEGAVVRLSERRRLEALGFLLRELECEVE